MYSDYEQPTFYCESWRKARKRHTCCECGLWVIPGQKYFRAEGVWDDELTTYTVCKKCQEFALESFEYRPPFGHLVEWIQESGGGDPLHYLTYDDYMITRDVYLRVGNMRLHCEEFCTPE